MQTCSKCHTLSPDAATFCPGCQADLHEWSETAAALKRFLKNPRVQYIRIAVASDCCPACRRAQGAYDKNEVPKLPVEGCSHENGCRCFYEPFLTEIYP